MKVTVALLALMVVFAAVPESEGWRVVRRIGAAFRRAVVELVKRVIQRKVINPIRDLARNLGKRDGLDQSFLSDDMSDEDLLTALATRDLSELIDMSQLTADDLTELEAIQRETRELVTAFDDGDAE